MTVEGNTSRRPSMSDAVLIPVPGRVPSSAALAAPEGQDAAALTSGLSPVARRGGPGSRTSRTVHLGWRVLHSGSSRAYHPSTTVAAAAPPSHHPASGDPSTGGLEVPHAEASARRARGHGPDAQSSYPVPSQRRTAATVRPPGTAGGLRRLGFETRGDWSVIWLRGGTLEPTFESSGVARRDSRGAGRRAWLPPGQPGLRMGRIVQSRSDRRVLRIEPVLHAPTTFSSTSPTNGLSAAPLDPDPVATVVAILAGGGPSREGRAFRHVRRRSRTSLPSSGTSPGRS